MLARLIEAWTDSVTERAYQPAFLQMLVAQGHRIVHNTRHNALEYGKDVISVGPDGKYCAYQLKGDPGGRLGKSGVSELLPQLRELTFLAIDHPNVPVGTRHKAFLVTNGEIDEEAWPAIKNLNDQLTSTTPATSLEVISRGEFLDSALKLEAGLWPQLPDDWNALLNLLATDGRLTFPLEPFSRLVGAILGAPTTRAALRRNVASAAVFTGLVLREFSLRENHFAEASAWVTFAACALSAAETAGYLAAIAPFIDIAEDAARTSLIRLMKEACTRKLPAEPDLGEPLVYQFRLPLLTGLAGLLCFWLAETDAALRYQLRAFVSKHLPSSFVWGEGAVPSLLIAAWALGSTAELKTAEQVLVRIVNDILRRALREGAPLYGPYWDGETILTHFLAEQLGVVNDPLEEEATSGESYFAEALLQVLARHNLKSTCQRFWPQFTKITIRRFQPSRRVDYYSWRSRRGRDSTWVPPARKEWSTFLREAYSRRNRIPIGLSGRPFLLALITIIMPHRCTTDVVRYLADHFDSSWSRGAGKFVV